MLNKNNIKIITDINNNCFSEIQLYNTNSSCSIPSIISDESYKTLELIYKDACQKKGQVGFSKTLDASFVKGFFIKYYDRGGFAIVPVFLIKETKDYVREEKNPSFVSLYDNYQKNCMFETYKRLIKLSFNHVLPNGQIIEYLFDENNHFKGDITLNLIYDSAIEIRNFILAEKILRDKLPIPKNKKTIKV